jgi:hypothetical protein
MGLFAERVVNKTNEKIENSVDPLLNYFTPTEIESILSTLNNSTFYTKQIETLYSGIYKLQLLLQKLKENG